MLHPNIDVLWVQSDEWRVFDDTIPTLITEDDWIPATGDVLLHRGPPSTLEAGRYHWIIVDRLLNQKQRAPIVQQATCAVTHHDNVFMFLPAERCFPNGTLRFGDHRVRFATAPMDDEPSRE